MSLEYYAKRVSDTKGLEHQLNLRALRDYLRTTNRIQILRQIDRMSEHRYLRALWEAGLSTEYQEAALARATELAARRGGT